MTVVRDITVHILYTDKVSVKNTMMRKSVHFNNYTEYISHFDNVLGLISQLLFPFFVVLEQ